jgi:hypothetical protein
MARSEALVGARLLLPGNRDPGEIRGYVFTPQAALSFCFRRRRLAICFG